MLTHLGWAGLAFPGSLGLCPTFPGTKSTGSGLSVQNHSGHHLTCGLRTHLPEGQNQQGMGQGCPSGWTCTHMIPALSTSVAEMGSERGWSPNSELDCDFRARAGLEATTLSSGEGCSQPFVFQGAGREHSGDSQPACHATAASVRPSSPLALKVRPYKCGQGQWPRSEWAGKAWWPDGATRA